MINNSLMAKIHTVDWTPAILPNPALQIGMNANWWGLAGEHVKKYLGRISTSEAISGITGSATNQTGADYCLTEEFVSVYRLHPLLPNDIPVRHFQGDRPGRTLKFDADNLNDPDLIVGPNAMKNALRRCVVSRYRLHFRRAKSRRRDACRTSRTGCGGCAGATAPISRS